MSVRGLRALALFGLCAVSTTPVFAQSYRPSSSTSDFLTSADFDSLLTFGRQNNVSVRQRPRPEYEALGVRRGAFLVFPRFETGVGLSDNILSSTSNPQDDAFLVVDPSVAIESQWSLHALNAEAGIQHREVLDNSRESQTGGYVNLNGRYDFGGDLSAAGNLGASRVFEGRSSTNSLQDIAEPIEVDQVNGGAQLVKSAGRFRGLVGIDAASLDYADAETFSGAIADQDYRDQNLVRYSARGETAISPDTSVFGLLNYTTIDYDQGGPQDRSSDEVRALVGGNFDITALIRGEIGVGYINREYDNGSFGSLKGLAALARVEYFPTELLTITGQYRRAVDDAALGAAGGFFLDDLTLTADYELLRNFIVSGQVSYQHDDFEAVDRVDNLWGASIGGQYLVTRTIGLGATLSYLDRSSDGAVRGPTFDETRLVFTVVFQR